MAKRYNDSGMRMTDCCGVYSTYDQDETLYCKKCFGPVDEGQGDGMETLEECDHRDSGRGVCVECGKFLRASAYRYTLTSSS